MSDIRPAGAPEPLSTDEADVEFVDADTRAWGGPHYAELEAYVETLGDRFDLAEAFGGAEEHTRRPVDLVGLLEIAHRRGTRRGRGGLRRRGGPPRRHDPPLRFHGGHRRPPHRNGCR